MEALTLQQIADYAGGRLRGGDVAREVHAISTDTRTLTANELFLALRGEKFDGHDYVEAAAEAGALGAIVEAGRVNTTSRAGFALIEVEDTLAAYQSIAHRYRQSLDLRIIAITGSNGKTSTKDLTAAVVSRRFRVLKTEGNFNNHIGVPRMLLCANRKHEVAVIEIGMNHPGEIAPLARIAAPDVAIITNIGRAHLEFMGTRDAIAQEKGMLAEAVPPGGTVILNGLDEYTESISRRTRAQVVAVGDPKDALYAESIEQGLDGNRFSLVAGSERFDVMLPVPGRHMIANALLAIAAGASLGIPLAECALALSDVKLTKGRLERKQIHGRIILDDSYNANPDSMKAALETLASMPTSGRRFAVLGKMGELGDAAEDGYRQTGEVAAEVGIEHIVSVGPESRAVALAAAEAGARNAISLENTDEAAAWLRSHTRAGDLILIKGSRSAATERVVSTLALLLASEKNTVDYPSDIAQAAR